MAQKKSKTTANMAKNEPEGIEPIRDIIPQIHKKGWGREVWLANHEKYCGKLLEFNAGASFSMHYHMLKHETFYVLKGSLKLELYDLSDATEHEVELKQGSITEIPAGNPHKLTALEDSVVIEISTQHFESDSYRIIPGDSQKPK